MAHQPTAAEAADAVGRWLAGRHDGRVDLLGRPTTAGDGYDTAVSFVRYGGTVLPPEWRRDLVLRVHPTADRSALARHEAAAQNWCADRGYPAPRVLAVFDAGDLVDLPLQVVERAPGRTMLAATLRAPWATRRVIRRLASLHADLHDLAPASFPAPPDAAGGTPLTLAARRLRPVPGWISQLPSATAAPLADALERVTATLPALDTEDPRVCHGDFHPLNVLLAGDGAAAVIDWTDVAVGDPHGDVARTALLFEVAHVASTSPVERAVLGAGAGWMRRTYLESYRRRRSLDDDRLRQWEAVHCLHGWGQVSALHAGLFPGASRAAGSVPPALAGWLERRFEAALAGPVTTSGEVLTVREPIDRGG